MLISVPVQLTSSRNIGPSKIKGKEFGPKVIASVETSNIILSLKRNSMAGFQLGEQRDLPVKSHDMYFLLLQTHCPKHGIKSRKAVLPRCSSGAPD